MVLKGERRHELSCSNCGAPLHNLKKMPTAKTARVQMQDQWRTGKPAKYRKKKKKKGLFSRILDEAWDAIEDIID